jgi:RNA polymerase sigma-70 factor (ECF subfamily)
VSAAADASRSDGSLVRAFQTGDAAAADRLYRRYAGRLWGLARSKASAPLQQRLDTDDIVQSVFRRFFAAARDGDYAVPAGDDIWNLLLAITLNKIRTEETFHRAAKRDVRRTTALGAGQDVPGGEGESLLRLAVAELLERLPAEYRAVVELRMFGHDVADIAQRLARSKRSVERILQESRRVLQAIQEG